MKRLYLKLIFSFVIILFFCMLSKAKAQCNSDSTDTTIATNTTWNTGTTHHISGNLVVDSNVTLTIRDTVKFRAGGLFIINPGGRVNLYGGTLSRECSNQMWGGVVINGNKTRSQGSTSSFDIGQGVLLSDSISVIEWMAIGVLVNNGGILIAYHTTFQNCRKAVAFSEYINSSNPKVNLGYFGDCDFLATSALPGYGRKAVDAFVSLNKVRGVSFSGDRFINSVSQTLINDRGMGIESIDANYVIYGGSPVTTSSDGCIASGGRRSVFQGFANGIWHRSTLPQFNINVFTSDFVNNQVAGITCYGDYYATIRGCHFLWDSNFILDSLSPFLTNGILLLASRRFDIDSNSFKNYYSGIFPLNLEPISVSNTTEGGGTIHNNYIYKFNDSYSPASAGIRIDNKTPSNDYQHNNFNPNLKISCNVFYSFKYDIIFKNGPLGMLADQGSTTVDAANMFSTCSSGHVRIHSDQGTCNYFTNFSNSNEYNTSCNDASVVFINVNNLNPCTPTDCLTKPR